MANMAAENKQDTGLNYTVKTLDKLVPMQEFVRECVRVFTVALLCAGCENYGRRWSCPPFNFALLPFWHQYESIWLFGRVLTPMPGTKASTMLAGMEREKYALLEHLLKLETEYPASLALSAGCCTLCEEGCTRPKMKCAHSEKMRFSIEALGGDVSKASERYLDTPLLWIKDGQVPDYLALVGGLLMPTASVKLEAGDCIKR